MSVALHVTDRNSWRVLSLSGRVDAFSDKRIHENLRQSVPDGRSVVLDLSRCDFLSLWLLRMIGLWADELVEQGCGLAVMTPTDGVLRQLQVFVGQRLPVYRNWDGLEVETFYRQPRPPPISRAAAFMPEKPSIFPRTSGWPEHGATAGS